MGQLTTPTVCAGFNSTVGVVSTVKKYVNLEKGTCLEGLDPSSACCQRMDPIIIYCPAQKMAGCHGEAFQSHMMTNGTQRLLYQVNWLLCTSNKEQVLWNTLTL